MYPFSSLFRFTLENKWFTEEEEVEEEEENGEVLYWDLYKREGEGERHFKNVFLAFYLFYLDRTVGWQEVKWVRERGEDQ